MRRAFQRPVGGFLFVEAAGVANPLFYFAVLVFAGGYAQHILAFVPKSYVAVALVGSAVAVRIHGLGEPHALFEAPGFIGERAHRAHVDDVAAELVIDDVFDVGTDFRRIAAAQHAVHAVGRELVGHVHTTVAQDAARHVQLNERADVDFLERAALFLVAGRAQAVLKGEVLQVALAGLVAHRAVERVVDEQHFHNALAHVHHLLRSRVLDHHAVLHRGDARGHQFGHRPRVFGRAGRHAHQAGAALAARALQRGVVAHGGRHNAAANLAGRVQDGRSVGNFHLNAVERYFSHWYN